MAGLSRRTDCAYLGVYERVDGDEEGVDAVVVADAQARRRG